MSSSHFQPRRRFEDLGARLARRILPRTPDFGALLVEQAALVADALDTLSAYCDSGDPNLAEKVARLEKDGDRLRERNVLTLARAFSTTFDRGLTAVAIQRIDDVANYAKTTVREMQALDLEPDAEMAGMAAELAAGGHALALAAKALGSDPGAVDRHVRQVHKQERRIEKRYRAAIAALFPVDPAALATSARGDDPAAIVAGIYDAVRRREVYRHLSNAADRLDGAGHVLQEISLTTI